MCDFDTLTNNLPVMTSLLVTGHNVSSRRGNPPSEREWSYPSWQWLCSTCCLPHRHNQGQLSLCHPLSRVCTWQIESSSSVLLNLCWHFMLIIADDLQSPQGRLQASPRARAAAEGRGQEAESQGDAELPQGGLCGAHQARGAPQAPWEDVLCQADPREGPDSQALAPVQVHLQQLYQGGWGPAVKEDLQGVQELCRQQQWPQWGLRPSLSSTCSLAPVTKAFNFFSKIPFNLMTMKNQDPSANRSCDRIIIDPENPHHSATMIIFTADWGVITIMTKLQHDNVMKTASISRHAHSTLSYSAPCKYLIFNTY